VSLVIGQTYLIQWIDEPDPFYAVYMCEDRGFLCFEYGGKIVVCRPDHVVIKSSLLM